METNEVVLKLEFDPTFYNDRFSWEKNCEAIVDDIETEIKYHWHGYKLKSLKVDLKNKAFVKIY